jgi:transposase
VRVMVLDNLLEGVLKPDIYDPTLNPLYRDLLQHYGATALPCRVRDPDRKGKVEAGVGHAKRTPLKGMRFETLEEAQQALEGEVVETSTVNQRHLRLVDTQHAHALPKRRQRLLSACSRRACGSM